MGRATVVLYGGPVNPMRKLADAIGGHPVFSMVGRALVPVDTVLHRASRGRWGLGTIAGVRTLLLHTVGRRSGQRRTTPLLYVGHGGGYLVVGSNWGGARHPGWSANLLAHPAASVTVDGRDVPVRARLLTDDEREHLWPLLIGAWPAYDDYAARAQGREIRVFLLEPVDPL